MSDKNSEHLQQPRGLATLLLIALLFLFAFGGLLSLGIWQLQRLDWKVDLIERVEARIHAEPVAPPSMAEWPDVSRERDEYRRVRLEGHYLPGRDTQVQAVTELGSGFWILSPLQLRSGGIVLVNRGFVPSGWPGDTLSPEPRVLVGLLRISEPGGGFLRSNDVAADRWYSRDVVAIAAARDLSPVAPYFVDLQRSPGAEVAGAAEPVGLDVTASQPQWPRAGLTVVRFNNNHLGYALTWFALALGVAWTGWRVAAEERKLRASNSR